MFSYIYGPMKNIGFYVQNNCMLYQAHYSPRVKILPLYRYKYFKNRVSFLLWSFETSPLPKEQICLPITIRVVKSLQFPPTMRSLQGAVFPDAHFKTPYQGSPAGGLFGKINIQHLLSSIDSGNATP